jgi:MFS-type transporter involved in bile tolerance (Atg22 family)
MKYILIGLSLVSLLFLSSCGAITGSIDFGFIKIPTFLILGVIIVYIIYRRNHK